jgi:hypothetical protein
MVILGILLDGYRRRIELLRPEFLYLLDLLLEALVLILREHILKFIVKLLLSVFHVYLEGVSV